MSDFKTFTSPQIHFMIQMSLPCVKEAQALLTRTSFRSPFGRHKQLAPKISDLSKIQRHHFASEMFYPFWQISWLLSSAKRTHVLQFPTHVILSFSYSHVLARKYSVNPRQQLWGDNKTLTFQCCASIGIPLLYCIYQKNVVCGFFSGTSGRATIRNFGAPYSET